MPIEMSSEEFRRLGNHVVEILAKRLETIYDDPARPVIPKSLREEILNQPLPETGTDPAILLERVANEVLPYPMGNVSPAFFAWVNSTPAPLGVLADFMAAWHDPSAAGGNHAATYVEHAALGWVKELMGYPREAGGVLTVGGSLANLTGLNVMRYVKAEQDVREHGMQDQPRLMTVYVAEQGHSSLQKAFEMLGIGSKYMRKVPVDAEFRIDVKVLRDIIARDRADGFYPACIAASAGTVNTGAIDPLDELADLCAEENLWLHVDGAYGAPGILDPSVSHLYKGLERADSITLDPHKWMYIPVECGCSLVRDAEAMRNASSLVPEYLRSDREEAWFSEYHIQQTRAFRALKLWLTIQQLGRQGYSELISRDIALTKTLKAKVEAHPNLEVVASGPLSILCFRYVEPDLDDATLSEINRRIIDLMQEDGRVFTTGTDIRGLHVIRTCIVNFRTREQDLDLLLSIVTELAKKALQEV